MSGRSLPICKCSWLSVPQVPSGSAPHSGAPPPRPGGCHVTVPSYDTPADGSSTAAGDATGTTGEIRQKSVVGGKWRGSSRTGVEKIWRGAVQPVAAVPDAPDQHGRQKKLGGSSVGSLSVYASWARGTEGKTPPGASPATRRYPGQGWVRSPRAATNGTATPLHAGTDEIKHSVNVL